MGVVYAWIYKQRNPMRLTEKNAIDETHDESPNNPDYNSMT